MMISMFAVTAVASEFARVDRDLAEYDRVVATMKSDFSLDPAMPLNKEWVQKKLQFMFDIDQYMRACWKMPVLNKYSAEETAYFKKKFLSRSEYIDDDNADDLKELMKIYPWFTISQFGKAGDNQAWIIVQHADRDPEFQQRVLAKLESLYPIGETEPKNYAYLYDRIQSSWNAPEKRQLQRYGTQGMCVAKGTWEPLPMEEPEKVDQRRASVGLGTLAEYKGMFKEICR